MKTFLRASTVPSLSFSTPEVGLKSIAFNIRSTIFRVPLLSNHLTLVNDLYFSCELNKWTSALLSSKNLFQVENFEVVTAKSRSILVDYMTRSSVVHVVIKMYCLNIFPNWTWYFEWYSHEVPNIALAKKNVWKLKLRKINIQA